MYIKGKTDNWELKIKTILKMNIFIDICMYVCKKKKKKKKYTYKTVLKMCKRL